MKTILEKHEHWEVAKLENLDKYPFPWVFYFGPESREGTLGGLRGCLPSPPNVPVLDSRVSHKRLPIGYLANRVAVVPRWVNRPVALPSLSWGRVRFPNWGALVTPACPGYPMCPFSLRLEGEPPSVWARSRDRSPPWVPLPHK